MDQDTMERVEELKRNRKFLREEIDRNEEYYQIGLPKMKDKDFDLLESELYKVESKIHQLTGEPMPADSVFSRIYSTEQHNCCHSSPMLSMNKRLTMEDVKKYFVKLEGECGKLGSYVIEPKVDGIACSLRYEYGVLRQVMTRGNGMYGTNITKYVDQLYMIPTTLKDVPDFFEVRGELYIPCSLAPEVRAKELPLGFSYMNRDIVASAMKRSNVDGIDRLFIVFIAHSFGRDETCFDYEDFMCKVNRLGFWTVIHQTAETIDEAIDCCRDMDIKRRYLDYDTDGVVIKLNEFNRREKTSYTGRNFRWAMAYKPWGDIDTVIIQEIEEVETEEGEIVRIAHIARPNGQPACLGVESVSQVKMRPEDKYYPGWKVRVIKQGNDEARILDLADDDE